MICSVHGRVLAMLNKHFKMASVCFTNYLDSLRDNSRVVEVVDSYGINYGLCCLSNEQSSIRYVLYVRDWLANEFTIN